MIMRTSATAAGPASASGKRHDQDGVAVRTKSAARDVMGIARDIDLFDAADDSPAPAVAPIEPDSGGVSEPAPTAATTIYAPKRSRAEILQCARAAKGALRRIAERELAYAIADWLEGGEFTAQDAVFAPYDGLSLKLRADGNLLVAEGHPVLRRHPIRQGGRRAPEIVASGHSLAEKEARPICHYVLQGDHRRMFR